jgi:predicted nucleotidyltransferase
MTKSTIHTSLAQTIAKRFEIFPQVEAIALGGSLTSGTTDQYSDIDLYIYTTKEIPVVDRKKIVEELGASRQDLGLTFWDSGDEWFHKETGIEVDVIFWDPNWIEEQIDRVVIQHQASVGYTTCFWHTIKNSQILFDRKGWFVSLRKKCDTPYPTQLKRNIIDMNFPVLRDVIPSYYYQIKKAIDRDDKISINHRVAALLASYFDVLFAINGVTNPGEKKILPYVLHHCSKLPPDMTSQIDELLFASSANPAGLLAKLDVLLNSLENLVELEGV